MSTPAGIGFCNPDNTISYIIVSDNGWIKDGIGDILLKDYNTELAARELIESHNFPTGFFPLCDMETQKADVEFLFMRKCLLFPRHYVFYTYLWKKGQWYFRRLDGSGDLPLSDAIAQGIED